MGLLDRFLDWLRSLFFKQEMELSLVGLQNAGKTSLVNVISVSLPPLVNFRSCATSVSTLISNNCVPTDVIMSCH